MSVSLVRLLLLLRCVYVSARQFLLDIDASSARACEETLFPRQRVFLKKLSAFRSHSLLGSPAELRKAEIWDLI